MSTTIPVELNGNEFISDVISARNTETGNLEYFIKINGDPACYVNFQRLNDTDLTELDSSDDLTKEFKEAVKKSLLNYLINSHI